MDVSKIASTVRMAAQGARRNVGVTVGAAAQSINTVLARSVRSCEHTDTIVMQGRYTSEGAQEVISRTGPHAVPARFDELRTQRPLLASTQIALSGERSTARVSFEARAAGADFRTEGREAGLVSVYLNGRYHSDVAVLSERPSRYVVNLGNPGQGAHQVELRASTDLATPFEPVPVRVDNVASQEMTGEQALIDRFAPLIETRWDPDGARHPATFNDIPLMLVPKVEPRPDGGSRIFYHGLFSHEDGGTPVTRAFQLFGRSTDYEWVYRVDVDAAGRFVSDRFQGPVHVPRRFKGTRDGDRPVLRVGTPNNLYTSRSLGVTPRWSEAPIAPTQHAHDDRHVMSAHPWTYAVMGKELVREGRTVMGRQPALDQALDARQHLYLQPGDPAEQILREHKHLPILLRDGRVVSAQLVNRGRQLRMPGALGKSTAVPLPHNVTADAVAGLPGIKGKVFGLDQDFRPYQLAVVDGYDGAALARQAALDSALRTRR